MNILVPQERVQVRFDQHFADVPLLPLLMEAIVESFPFVPQECMSLKEFGEQVVDALAPQIVAEIGEDDRDHVIIKEERSPSGTNTSSTSTT